MNRTGSRTRPLWAVGVATFALLAMPFAVFSTTATVVAGTTGGPQSWAYGTEKWVNTSIQFDNATYTQHAFFGWHTIFTATNTSATTQAWTVDRTAAGSFFADYCQPNCTAPVAHGNLTVTGWETDLGFANLTSTAVVYDHGTAVPAIGLANASFQNSANLSESLDYALTAGPIVGTASAGFTIGGAAHGSVAPSPALGLVPLNLSTGQSWNSSSTFVSSGGWALAFSTHRASFGGNGTGSSGNASGSLVFSGTLALQGGDVGSVTLANGATVPVVVVAWTGPFDSDDGVILVPHDFDLFGGGAHEYGEGDVATEAFATSALDVQVVEGHHLGIVAAATTYGSADTTLGSAGTTVGMAAGPAAGPTTTSVQGQPESVPQAQRGSACLLGNCSAATATGGAPGWLAPLLVVAVAVSLVGLLVGLRGRGRRGVRSDPTAPTQTATIVPPPGASGAP